MNRTFLLRLTLILSGFLVIALFNNCQGTTIGGSRDGGSPRNNGTSVGNPMAPVSQRLASNICATVLRCHSEVQAIECDSGLNLAKGFADPLNLDSKFDDFSSIQKAEEIGDLVANVANSEACSSHLAAVHCSDSAVQRSYQPENSQPFAEISRLLATPNCASVFTPPSYFQAVLRDAPLRYWRLNEAGGSQLIDSIGGHVGTLTSDTGVGFAVPGAVSGDSALEFSSSGSAGRILSTVAELSQGPGSFVTVEFWMRWSGGGGAAGMIPFSLNPSGYGLWLLPIESAFGFNTGTGDIYGIQGTSVSGLAGRWVHVVAVFESGASSDSMPRNKLYLDGVEQNLRQVRAPSSAVTRSVEANLTINDPVHAMSGSIDEFAIYGFALSSESVQRHFEASR